MRIRRSMHARDLRTAPIDRVDAFLLTRVVDTMPLSELLDVAPCDEREVLGRLEGLAELGLVELLGTERDERFFASAPRDAYADPADDAVTLRPPRPHAGLQEEAVTLWPPTQPELTLDLDDFGDPAQTGIRARLPTQALERAADAAGNRGR